MNASQRIGFRWILRENTREKHDAVEREFDKFILNSTSGMSAFLSAHWLALNACQNMFSTVNHLKIDISLLKRLIECDLEGLGAKKPDENLLYAESHNPVGMAYVIAGSHLGAKVLTARLKAEAEPVILENLSYLGNNHLKDVWKHFCTDVGDVDIPDDADLIVSGANAGFELFRKAVTLTAPEEDYEFE